MKSLTTTVEETTKSQKLIRTTVNTPKDDILLNDNHQLIENN